MERVAIDFGPIQIYWYSIIVFVGLLIGSIIIFKEARKRKISEEFLINLICDYGWELQLSQSGKENYCFCK